MKNLPTRTILSGIGVGILVLALLLGGVSLYRWAVTRWGPPPPPPPASLCEAQIESSRADLSWEQARNASIIAGVAAQRGLVPRAVSIGITTAFQESGIRNLDYGDRDSLGIFQQRPSQGWGTEEQIMDPYYATGKFYDVMVTVDDWENADIGDVAQEVQRSGFPDAYDQHVATARILASALSGETPASWSCIVHDSSPADPDQLLAQLTRAYGATVWAQIITPDTVGEPQTIEITASTEQVAWSAGAFAQSWATQTGVTKVKVGEYEWTASPTVLAGWVGVPGDAPDPTSVTVTF